MINLLPKETTRQIKAGHHNVFLMKSITIIGSITIFLALASAGSYIYLLNAKQFAENSTGSSAVESAYQKAKIEADAINTNITNSQNILAQKISYSKLVMELAKNIPAQMTLSNLTVDETSINQSLTLKIYAKSSANANQLQQNFNSSSVFTNYNVVSTTENQTDIPGYPTAITVTVNVNKGSIK